MNQPQPADAPVTGIPAADPSTPHAVAADVPAYRVRLRNGRAPAARPRDGFASPARTAARLTGRDRWILAMLAEHRILTSTQITRLAFGTRRVATLRLAALHSLGVVHRFRPYTLAGSAPWHWLLSPAGADLVADDHDTTPDTLGYHPERLARLAVSLHLAHTVGVNDVCTALAWHARRSPGQGRLTVWWSERRCEQAWGGRIHPDAYGRWHTPHHPSTREGAMGGEVEVDWFLEYDVGTENLDRVVAKLPAYARLAADTHLATPVLFWLPGARRETHLRHLVQAWQDTHPPHAHLPVATTHAGLPGGPAGQVWAPVLRAGPAGRVRIADLTNAFPGLARQPVVASPEDPGGQPETSLAPGPGPGWPAPAPQAPNPASRSRGPGQVGSARG